MTTTFFRGLIALITLSLFSGAAFAAPEGDKTEITYTVRSGDTLIGLAKRYFIDDSDFRLVQRRNNIANPRKMPIGLTIKIPVRILRYDKTAAQISAWRGDVQITGLSGLTLTPKSGLTLQEGTSLRTGRASSLSLTMDDGSVATMPSNSHIIIARLRKIILTNSVDSEFQLRNGGMESRVTRKNKAEDRYQIRTPVSVSAVRGTEFRTRYDESRSSSASELLEGGLALDAFAIGKKADLKPQFGAVISNDGLLTEKLLAPPALLSGNDVHQEKELAFQLRPQHGENGYVLEIARDSSYLDIVSAVQGKDLTLKVSELPNGNYFARVSAIAKSGLVGMPHNFTFKRRLNSIDGSAEFVDDKWHFRWSAAAGENDDSNVRQYRFQLYHVSEKPSDTSTLPDGGNIVPVVDEPGLSDNHIAISHLENGYYFWRIGVTLFDQDAAGKNAKPLENWTKFYYFAVN